LPTTAQSGYPPGSSAFLCFNPDTAHHNGVLYSTNNVGNLANVTGDGRQVGHNQMHLCALGKCGVAVYQAECLIYRPDFPKAVGASGTVQLLGSTVEGLRSSTSFTGSYSSVPEADRSPGNVFSNNCSGPPGGRAELLYLRQRRAMGLVSVNPGSIVGGEVDSYAAVQTVPYLNVPSMVTRVAAVGAWSPTSPVTP